MKRGLSFGLFILLLCHTLAHVLVGLSAWWQDKHDLSERLLVYQTVDSIVEFQIPLTNKADGPQIASTTQDGFTHQGHDYDVVSLEIRVDTLHITGLESTKHSFWQNDLLTFLKAHLGQSRDTGRKTNQLLKFLLKEYSPTPRIVFQFMTAYARQSVRVPNATFAFATRSVAVHSPPPRPITC